MNQRRILVSGCSSGFGLGIAVALAARGWYVFAGVRDPTRAPAQLVERVNVRVLSLDLADNAQIVAVAEDVGALDGLINNAGYALNGPFPTYSAAQMQHQLQVNVLGPALLMQHLLPTLAARRGRVINISSLCGETGLPMMSLYCASKFALEGLSESLHHEFKAHGVQLALVEPGGFRTRFGRNIVWGEEPPLADSPAARQLVAFRRLRATLMARPGADPAAVVDVVVRLAEMTRMPLRTRVGYDAKLLHGLARILPEAARHALVGASFRRLLDRHHGE